MLITSNLVFSEWSKIFKDPLTTASAIDRVVHHSVILEFADVKTFRGEAAEKRRAGKRNEVEGDNNATDGAA